MVEAPSFILSFVAGMVLFLSPCIAPVIPAYLSSIAGVRWSELNSSSKIRWKVMSNALAFVVGFSALFITMGLALGYFSSVMGLRTWINYIGGTIILVLALHMLELINIPLLNREFSMGGKVRAKGYFGSALMGGAFGLAWTPCTGPVLAAILALSATSGTLVQSAGLMASFSAGLAVPFLLTGAFTTQVSKWLSTHQVFMKWLNRVTGAVLVVLGVLIFTGRIDSLLGKLFGVFGFPLG